MTKDIYIKINSTNLNIPNTTKNKHIRTGKVISDSKNNNVSDSWHYFLLLLCL